MKKFFLLITLHVLFLSSTLLLLAEHSVAGDLNGICPLPYKYNVEFDGSIQQNQFPAACREKYSNGLSLYYNPFPDFPSGTTISIDEDTKHTFAFKASSNGNGTPMTVSEMTPGSSDPSTADKYEDWMPNINDYQDLEKDVSPKYPEIKLLANVRCYSFAGGYPDFKGYKSEDGKLSISLRDSVKWDWQGSPGWQCEKVFFNYHMDSPVFFGQLGNIGFNPKETGDSAAKGVFDFTYFVPSVPAWYAVTSVMNITWNWPHKYSHRWVVHHVGPPQGSTDGKCEGCGLNLRNQIRVEGEQPGWTADRRQDSSTYNADYWTSPPRECEFGGKKAEKWDASYFYSEKYKQNGKIQKPEAADERIGKPEEATGLDFYGVGVEPIYFPRVKFEGPNAPIIVARCTLYVCDIGNVAHVQTGIEGSSGGNLLNAECGETISSTNPGKDLTIRIVDNNPWSNQFIIDNLSGEGALDCRPGKWADKNFKVTFWYEIPLYQYVSILSEEWLPPEASKIKAMESVYSPIFVWKSFKWNSLSEFLSGDDGSTTTQYFVTHENSYYTEQPFDPSFIVFNKKIPISRLFIDQNKNVEEIVPLHYANKSLGDAFGNPPYDAKDKNTLYGNDIADASGSSIISKFKIKPINYMNGKGHLKYFVEIHDASDNTNGGGGDGENKYDCSEKLFKADDYTQGCLKYNPEKVIYVPKSNDVKKINEGEAVDPIAPVPPCPSQNYDEESQNIWKKNPALLKALNSNVDNGENILNNFQAWGRIEIFDKKKPNLGLKILNTVTGKIRYVFKLNDISRFKNLFAKPDYWSAYFENVKFNYPMYDPKNLVGKIAPYSNSEDLWLFKDVKLLVDNNPGPNKILYEGRDFLGEGDSIEDSLDPYGTVEDTPIQFTHQDLRNDEKKVSFVEFFAHDNIDGQRVIKSGTKVKKEDWYKGVISFDFDSNKEKSPVFPEDMILKGYTSWKIIDETYKDYINNVAFKKFYMKDEYYKYPLIVFNNPNCNPDGTSLFDKDVEMSVMYGVVDRSGNFRKLKLHLYVMPITNKINVIERKN